MIRSILILLAWQVAGPTASALDLYVAPSGNDANPGTQDQPFATLTGARDAIRQLKIQGPLEEPVRVVVADGEYTLAEPLVLEPQDSGMAKAPISYEAAPGATPIFSGGRTITGWTEGENGVWTAEIPEVASGDWYFEQLFVDGRRATRPAPNGSISTSRTSRKWPPSRPRGGQKAVQTVTMRPGDSASSPLLPGRTPRRPLHGLP